MVQQQRGLIAAKCVLLLCAAHAGQAFAQTGGPDNSNRLQQIRTLIVSGRDEQALQQIEVLRTEKTAAPGLDRAEGDALYDLGRLRIAEQAYRRALTVDPHDEASAQMLGLTLFKLGRPKDAIPLLETNHASDAQTKADPTYVLALCYMDTMQYDAARHAFAAQYAFPLDSAAAYLLTARMLLRREFKPIAREYAEKALAMQPGIPGAHELLGEMALGQNALDDAIRQFDQEQQINPLAGLTYERLGDAFTRAGRYGEAERTLQKAVLLEPNSTGPYILLGKALLKQGQPVGAMTFLQKAETMDPANYMTHNLLAQAYRSIGRESEASREFALTEKSQAANEPSLATPR